MEEHLAAGDEITILNCDSSLQACDANPSMALPHCLACMATRQSAVEMLSSQICSLPLVKSSVLAEMKTFMCPEFRTLDELQAYTWNGLRIGRDVISSLVTATGSPCFDPSKRAGLVRKTMRDFVAVHLSALGYLEEQQFALVYVFNGRFVPAKAWIRACEKTKTDYTTLERLGMPDRVLRIKNGSPHDTLRYGPLINEFWLENRTDPQVLKEAKDFFEERPEGRLTGWHSFVSDQKAGRLPGSWDPEKRNMAIFSSTESEFAGLPEYFKDSPFKDQKKAYADLAAAVKTLDESVHFYLRVHPNSRHEKSRWWEDPALHGPTNLTVIEPGSPVSSYELLGQCEKTIVFMTTMGIEATYWGKPCIILSNAMYRGTGAAYEPKSLHEAADLVIARNQSQKSRESALAYGAFFRCGFPKLPFSEALDHCKLTFKGRRPNAPSEILTSLWNWEHHVSPAPVPSWAKKLWQSWEWFRLRRRLKL